jgi:biopolymer transport protein ExbB/TolQ
MDWTAVWAFCRRNWWKILLAPVALVILLYLAARWKAAQDAANRWRKAVVETHDIEQRANDARAKAARVGTLAVERVEEQYSRAIVLAKARETAQAKFMEEDRAAYAQAVNAVWGQWRSQ